MVTEKQKSIGYGPQPCSHSTSQAMKSECGAQVESFAGTGHVCAQNMQIDMDRFMVSCTSHVQFTELYNSRSFEPASSMLLPIGPQRTWMGLFPMFSNYNL